MTLAAKPPHQALKPVLCTLCCILQAVVLVKLSHHVAGLSCAGLCCWSAFTSIQCCQDSTTVVHEAADVVHHLAH